MVIRLQKIAGYIMTAFIISLPIIGWTNGLSDQESDYYVDKIDTTVIKKIQLNGEKNTHDSTALNHAMEQLSKNGGGIILIQRPKSNPYVYLNNVHVQSNIHLKIDSNVIFRPLYSVPYKKENIVMFGIGRDKPVENIAITSTKPDSLNQTDWFSVELIGNSKRRAKFVDVLSAKNFKISGIRITDSYTVFSNIELNLANTQGREPGQLPGYGVVKNVVSINNHVGYGVVQIRAGKHILFKNLDGTGGITVRIETGFPRKILTSAATIDSVVSRNITVRDGDAVFNLSPHRVKQGVVDARGLYVYNSAHAIQIAAGFPDNKGGVDELGTYDSRSYIGDIRVVKGGQTAQLKTKDFSFFSCERQKELWARAKSNLDNESTYGQSISVIRDGADPAHGCPANANDKAARGCYTINIDLPEKNSVTDTLFGSKMFSYQYEDNIKCAS